MSQKRQRNPHNRSNTREPNTKAVRLTGDEHDAKGRANNGAGWFSTHDDPAMFRSPKFEAYYRSHVVDNADWDACLEAALRPLPVSFRLSTIGGRHHELYEALQGDCFGLPVTPVERTIEGETVTICRPATLPWYSPLGYAYQIDLGKRALKRVPDLLKFRAFLMREDRQGNITRQEAVSMIPPQLLEAKPHHHVLDMCAAPGSKTAQLLEAIHAGSDPYSVPKGFVIANDADPRRSYMLVHQLKRLGSPNFLVTNHEGQFFPNLYTTQKNPTTGAISTEVLAFDRILCDVPCSGDGTVRKSPNIWRSWTVSGGFGLHPLQLSIAWRSAQLLKVGGRMVYSTCSLNPIENEAVVAELVRRSKGALRIVDASQKLPGLKRENGMFRWRTLFEGGSGFVKINSDGTPYVPATSQTDATEGKVDVQGQTEAQDKDDSASMTTEPQQNKPEKCAPNHYEIHTKALGGPVRMLELGSLDEVEALAPPKQRRVRLSFFAPHIIKQMQIDAQKKFAVALEEVKKSFEATQTELPNETELTSLATAKLSAIAQAALKQSHLPTAEAMNLDRCLRILPHRQDTGGFFIVLLEKVAPMPAWNSSGNAISEEEQADEVKNFSGEDATAETKVSDEESKEPTTILATSKEIKEWEASQPTDPSDLRAKRLKSKPLSGWFEFPFVPLAPTSCDAIESFFGLSSESHVGIASGYNRYNLFIRADAETGQGKRVYFLPELLGNIVMTPQNARLKVVHSGLKIFEATVSAKQRRAAATTTEGTNETSTDASDVSAASPTSDAEPKAFRVAQDGINFAVPHFGRQMLRATRSDIVAMLRNTDDGKRHIELSPQLQAQLAARTQGCLTPDILRAMVTPEINAMPAFNFWLSTKDLSYADYKAQENDLRAKAETEAKTSDSKAVNFPRSSLSPANLGPVELGSVVIELPVEELPEGSVNRILCAAWLTYNNLSLMVDKSEKNSLLEALDPQTVPTSQATESSELTESVATTEE